MIAQTRTNTAPLLCLALLVCGLVLALPHLAAMSVPRTVEVDELTQDITISLERSHAAKHGESVAEQVRHCLHNDGPVQVWRRGSNRYLHLCDLGDGRYGLQVIDRTRNGYDEITAFIKDKMCRLSQVEGYLQNSGAVRIWRIGEALERLPLEMVRWFGW